MTLGVRKEAKLLRALESMPERFTCSVSASRRETDTMLSVPNAISDESSMAAIVTRSLFIWISFVFVWTEARKGTLPFT